MADGTADPPDRAVPARQQLRRHRPHREPAAGRAARPADRGRQPRRRQRHARQRGGRPRRARRLHHGAREHDHARLGDRDAGEAGLRSGQGLHAGGADRQFADRDPGDAEAAGEIHPGTARARQGEARHAQLCVGRPRQHGASRRRAAGEDGQRPDDARALSRHRAVGHRPDGRAHRAADGHDRAVAGAYPRRQDARAWRPPAQSAMRNCRTCRPSPSPGLPATRPACGRAFVLPAKAPAAIVARINREVDRGGEFAGDARGARQAGRRGGDQHARGAGRADPQRRRRAGARSSARRGSPPSRRGAKA